MHVLTRPLAIGTEGEYEKVVFSSSSHGDLVMKVTWFSDTVSTGYKVDTENLMHIKFARELYSELKARGFKTTSPH